MDDAVEASTQRVHHHLRRPIPGSPKPTDNTAGNTASAIDPISTNRSWASRRAQGIGEGCDELVEVGIVAGIDSEDVVGGALALESGIVGGVEGFAGVDRAPGDGLGSSAIKLG
jgi:hypothetical protein